MALRDLSRLRVIEVEVKIHARSARRHLDAMDRLAAEALTLATTDDARETRKLPSLRRKSKRAKERKR